MEQAEIRVRGRVQGVGFRPAVWRLAHELGLSGDVRNDADGVLIRVEGREPAIAALLDRLRHAPPPLACVERIERIACADSNPARTPGFHILETVRGATRTDVAPDAAMCPACAREVLDPRDRRHRYAFANCTQCGPRLSIVHSMPFERTTTTMLPFALCAACQTEYTDPSDRRFHAEAIACPECGPRLRLVPSSSHGDDIGAASDLLRQGGILAVKGLGGYQIACNAANAGAVARLRAAKQRDRKPFALMARDLDMIRQYCAVDDAAAKVLCSPEAPIVLLRTAGFPLPDTLAPGLTTLGFMLPTTPLHMLLLCALDRPVVMTSGNLSGEPQIIDDAEALDRLGAIADAVLTHDRAIATRIDDSVVRLVAGVPRVQRRARGFAPATLTLPDGFAGAPDLFAAGGEQKATFCLLQDGRAILSQHIGDLDDARTFDAYRRTIADYAALFAHAPHAVAVDLHPEYLSSKFARESGLPVIEVQHHHAHVASCLAENDRVLNAPPVLGIVLDGLGWGDDGTVWGGEFLLADYRNARRIGSLKPVALLGGDAATREPWRNLYAHLTAAGIEPFGMPAHSPRGLLDAMLRNRVNAPLSSSCGRLFDAMAAALGICAGRQSYEGEVAARLEALACPHTLCCEDAAAAYPMEVADFLDPRPMWRAVVDDLASGMPPAVMAARFHNGLVRAIVTMTRSLAERHSFDTVVLSGGCFQNAILLEQTQHRLHGAGFSVLTHLRVPTNDGGLALGQAAVAAARLLAA